MSADVGPLSRRQSAGEPDPSTLAESSDPDAFRATALAIEGEALARRLTDFLVIKRNGSVSERLWRLVMPPEECQGKAEVDARWLGEIPPAIWQIVQDRVLKCT